MIEGAEEGPPLAGPYVVGRLRELDAALALAMPRVVTKARDRRGGEHDDEAIHDLRVAIRRMRTLLKMSRGLFGRWHTDVVREAFAVVMRATGELRDEEVLEETLARAAEGAADFQAWLEERKAREAKLRGAVVSRIERGELDRARLMLKALLVFPIEPKRNVELSRFARRTVERARRKVEKRRDVAVTDVVAMHDLRIAYKELRYSIELLADALPIDARAQLEPATVFQKRLGELHDVDVATEVVQKTKGLTVDTRVRALASLAAMRDKRVNKYLRELDPLGAGVRRGLPPPSPSPPPPPIENAERYVDAPAGQEAPIRRSRAKKEPPAPENGAGSGASGGSTNAERGPGSKRSV